MSTPSPNERFSNSLDLTRAGQGGFSSAPTTKTCRLGPGRRSHSGATDWARSDWRIAGAEGARVHYPKKQKPLLGDPGVRSRRCLHDGQLFTGCRNGTKATSRFLKMFHLSIPL